MDELIRLDTKNEGFPIDARELHEKLEVGRDFSNWIKGRIDQYGFIEDVDYKARKPAKSSLTKSGVGTRTAFERIDYSLSLDTGKELAMVENNDQGRKIRRYFIEVEKQYRVNQLQLGKMIRRELTDALQDSGLNEKMHGWGYKTFTDLIYKLVLGMNAKQYREALQLPIDANIREHLNDYQKQEIARLENAAQGLVNIGLGYDEIKQILSDKFLKKLN